MTKGELIDAVVSQRNRYNVILDILSVGWIRETPSLCTMIEDAAEYGIHIMRDWCEVEMEEGASESPPVSSTGSLHNI